MNQFVKDQLEAFLGVVRKYMQVRGGLSQKDLAEKTGIGVSTMSRFLNQQTKELNPQLIAKIVAMIDIPLHEIIDFVDEEYSDHFIRLVKFYKGEPIDGGDTTTSSVREEKIGQGAEGDPFSNINGQREGDNKSNAHKKVTGKIRIGNKTSTVSYDRRDDDKSNITEQLKNLTARQRAFLVDFLNLDNDGRDLVVDIGKNIIGYLRQKGIDF